MEEYIMEPLVIGGRCKITTTLQNFNSCNYKEIESNEYDCDDNNFKKYFNVKFYCSVDCDKNEEYISIIFRSQFFRDYCFYNHPLKFSCVASVIDSSGDNRFLQTALFDSEYDPEDNMRLTCEGFFKDKFIVGSDEYYSNYEGFGFEKYIKRSTLLSDPSELLPNDSLSLCLEIEYEVETGVLEFPRFGEMMVPLDGDSLYLPMYSDFGRELCKMSSVLRRMVCSSMIESKTELLKVPREEINSFRIIFCILGETGVCINTMKNICDLYILADMYDMQQIIEVCRQLFVSTVYRMESPVIREFVNKNIQDITELARTFSKDEILVDILRILSDYSDKLKDGNFCGLTLSQILDSLSVIKLETEWFVSYHDKSWKEPYLLFSKFKTEDLSRDIYK